MVNLEFRVWDKKYKEYTEEPFYRLTISLSGKVYNSESDEWYDRGERYILQQYTGKKDGEGNKIFDGDIVLFDRREWGGDDNIHVVSWDNENAEWCWGGGSTSDMCWRKVIGNIYETPELLTD